MKTKKDVMNELRMKKYRIKYWTRYHTLPPGAMDQKKEVMTI